MRFLILILPIISALIFSGCTSSSETNVTEEKSLSDTLFDHFKWKSTENPSIKLQIARYHENGNLEWIEFYKKEKNEIYADYSLNKKQKSDEASPWNIFNFLREQGTKKDSILFEPKHEKILNRVFFQIENNPAKPVEPCFDCPFGNLSQVLLSDSSILIQGSQDLQWSSFDSLVTLLLE